MRKKSFISLIFLGLIALFTAWGTWDSSDPEAPEPTTETRETTETTDIIESTENNRSVYPDEPETSSDINANLALGNPSNATAEESNYNNFLITKPQYVLSYSRDRGIANWVSWHVNKDWVGSTDRQDNFRPDDTLPTDWPQIFTSDYTGSGFDRGHSCPSGDRTNTPDDNAATFLLTNIFPQAPQNNRETWGNLEEYLRRLVDDGQEVYVIMGSYGEGGTGSKGRKEKIGKGKITVPNRIWKVALVLPEGQNDLKRINSSTRVIAIDTPNSNSVNPDWTTYLTTVDAIEQNTGYNLLSSLPVTIQDKLESEVDSTPVQ